MNKELNLDQITKIEGNARLHISIKKGNVSQVKLDIFEGARFFEGILKGKRWDEIPHVVSRICGVCSVSHTLAALNAIENCFGVHITKQTRQIRELLSIGGIIQSHVLHLYFLTLPSYFGYDSAIDMVKGYREDIERGLRLKRIGNEIVRVIAGRDVHPIAAVVGGFSRIPCVAELKRLRLQLTQVKKDAEKTIDLFLSLKYPALNVDIPYISAGGKNYFETEKIVKCERGICYPAADYENYFSEYFKKDSTAEYVSLAHERLKAYLVGALPRVIAKKNMLSKKSMQFVKTVEKNLKNPFMTNIAQAIEIYEGVLRAEKLLDDISFRQGTIGVITPKKSSGVGIIEAPRGLLFHKYSFDKEGYCTSANITSPTSQNLESIEGAVTQLLPSILNKGKMEIKKQVESLIRAYDPCISCATHFLEIEIEGC